MATMSMQQAQRTAHSLVGHRYTLLTRLGVGGMGQVYQAVDRLSGETIALKRLLTHVTDAQVDPTLRLALAQEFQALAGLRHPNIIGVRDYGFDQARQPYFTMDLLYNPRTLVAAGQLLGPEAKLQLLLPVLHALAYLHRRQIIHRDLKPSNILVSGTQVKVLDFGLATIAGQQQPASGTLRYMAPEVLRGGEATIAADLYAVGVIAYELFAGWHPFAPTGQPLSTDRLLHSEPDWTYLDLDPALIAVLQCLLAKDPQARYADAHSVIAALAAASGQALPIETIATRESFLQAAPLIGRERQLAQLTRALEQTVASQGSAWLIGGESGVGKSRLLSELRTQALVQGVTVLRGQASSDGGGAYHLWREIVRWLLLLADPTPLEAAVVKPLVPDSADLVGQTLPDAPELEPKAAQNRLLTTIATLIRRSTQAQPLLLLLEDLHWADENSLELLQWLMQSVLGQPEQRAALLVLATYRRGEAPHLPQRLPTMQTMLLPRLQPDQIQALSVAMLGTAGHRTALVTFLQQETEGNTFFVVETLRALAESAGQLDRVAEMTLPTHIFPQGVQQVVQRRLQRVPALDQPLLQWAAVAGRQLDLALLRTLATAIDLEQWLTACANAAVLESQDNRWQFAHDKLREGILQGIAPAERQRYHRQIGLALEQLYATQLSPHYANLAYHFGGAGDQSREQRYLQLAGETAQATYANQAAIGYYERLLALQGEADPAAIPVRVRLGDVLQFVGQWDAAEAQYRQALALSSQSTASSMTARAYQALGTLQRNRGDFGGALDWLRQAQEAFTSLQEGARLGEVLLEIGNVYYLQGAHQEGWHYLEQGLAVAQAAGNQAAVASALHRMGSLLYSGGNYAEARTYATQALALYEQLDNKVGMANALNNLANVERSTGDYATAQARRIESLALRQAIGDKWGIAASLNNLAIIPYLQADYATAQHYWQESLALRNELGDRWGAGQTLDNLGLVAFSQGDYTLARQRHEQSLTMRHEVGDQWGLAISLSNLAHAELYAGALDAARHHYQASVDLSLTLDDKRGIISCCIGLAGVDVAESAPTPATLATAVTRLSLARRLTTQTGAVLERDEEQLFAQTEERLRAQVPPATYATCWETGQQLSEEAIARFLVQKEAQ